MMDFFNIKTYFNSDVNVQYAMAQIVNSLMEAVNQKNVTLPKYLIMVIDYDILFDVVNCDINDKVKMLPDLINWLV